VLEAGARLRQALNFEVPARSASWDDVRKHLIRAFEGLGGLTVVTSMVDNNTRRSLNPDEFRGFTLVDEYAPLVFVNARQTLNGQIFTLAHEFAHVLHGTSGISLEDPAWEPQSEVERWCNAVASEFLVPVSDLAPRYREVAHIRLSEALDRLASIYKCGTLVILQVIRQHRLVEFEDFDAVYRQELERIRQFSREVGEGGGNFYYNQPFRIGERFSRAIIRDALEGRTTLSEAIRLTSLKSLSVFDKYAEHLGIA
jgi:Zn-dependent peptidase ImmA (M78 family)